VKSSGRQPDGLISIFLDGGKMLETIIIILLILWLLGAFGRVRLPYLGGNLIHIILVIVVILIILRLL
jgi:hypothetical protein